MKRPDSYNHLQSKKKKKKKLVLFTCVTSTLILLSVMKSSLLVAVLGGFVHAPSFVEMLSLCFLFPNGLWFQDANRPAGCHHCSL